MTSRYEHFGGNTHYFNSSPKAYEKKYKNIKKYKI